MRVSNETKNLSIPVMIDDDGDGKKTVRKRFFFSVCPVEDWLIGVLYRREVTSKREGRQTKTETASVYSSPVAGYTGSGGGDGAAAAGL